jgi:hypothetical protein
VPVGAMTLWRGSRAATRCRRVFDSQAAGSSHRASARLRYDGAMSGQCAWRIAGYYRVEIAATYCVNSADATRLQYGKALAFKWMERMADLSPSQILGERLCSSR